MIDKKKIHDLVGVFYRPTYKTFYVNSVDGESFTKPVGVFVSLGITTSYKVIEDIKNIISENNPDCITTIAELSSKKVGSQFMNTIVNVDSPVQYRLSDEGREGVLNESEAKEELDDMVKKMSPDQDLAVLNSLAPKISRLRDLIDRISESGSGGWDSHSIQRIPESEGSYGIFHKLVNYTQVGDIEYRLGIYVREKI